MCVCVYVAENAGRVPFVSAGHKLLWRLLEFPVSVEMVILENVFGKLHVCLLQRVRVDTGFQLNRSSNEFQIRFGG